MRINYLNDCFLQIIMLKMLRKHYYEQQFVNTKRSFASMKLFRVEWESGHGTVIKTTTQNDNYQSCWKK